MAGDGSLWPVIVGGAIALGGVVITNGINFLMKRAESQEAKKKARAEKFEELVEAVYAFDHWLRTKRDVTVYGDKEKLGASPLAKIEAIVAVHFPSLSGAVSAMDTGADQFELWMFEAAKKRLANKIDQVNEGIGEAYKPYVRGREALLKELREFGRKEFQ